MGYTSGTAMEDRGLRDRVRRARDRHGAQDPHRRPPEQPLAVPDEAIRFEVRGRLAVADAQTPADSDRRAEKHFLMLDALKAEDAQSKAR